MLLRGRTHGGGRGGRGRWSDQEPPERGGITRAALKMRVGPAIVKQTMVDPVRVQRNPLTACHRCQGLAAFV